jgi:hypothetical protein
MHENCLKSVATRWQSAHVVHRPGECRLPALMGKNGVWLNVEGAHADVLWHDSHANGNPAAACAGFVVAL